MDNKKRFEHPSYGVVSVGRVSSSGAHPLYGSSIKHRETIRLQFHKSHMDRMLSNNWYHQDGLLLEVELSPVQWAELVSGIGSSCIPCTLRYTTTDGIIEACPYLDTRMEFDEEFSKTVETAAQSMRDAISAARELLQKPNIKKADKEQILSDLLAAQNAMGDAIPFISRQFTGQMDRTVTEAKGEFEAFQSRRMQEIALAALASGHELGEVSPPELCVVAESPNKEPEGIDLRVVAAEIAAVLEFCSFNDRTDHSGHYAIKRFHVEGYPYDWERTVTVYKSDEGGEHYEVCCHYENGDVNITHTGSMDMAELEQALREAADGGPIQ